MEKREIKKSHILGGMLLVCGVCIGAGMLALPILTGEGGFGPSMIMFFIAWLFMTTTGLLLLEVNLSLEGNIISMVEKTLGGVGKLFCWITWGFLFYCLLVAYVAGTGAMLTSVMQNFLHLYVPEFVGSLLFVLLFGILVFLGTRAVDHFNRYLMLGLILTYVLLIVLGAKEVQGANLLRSHFSAMPFMLPVLVISFGFHNMVPSLVPYFHGDKRVLQKVIYLGSVIPMVIYVLWQIVVLGVLDESAIKVALQNGEAATSAMQRKLGSSWMGIVADLFGFFALITSFLTVALSFVHFLGDAFKAKVGAKTNFYLCILVLLPPLLFALSFPHIFLIALNYAGGIGAVILFGILPALMAWKIRYKTKESKHILVPGGKPVLTCVILFALLILGIQIGSAFV